MIIAVFKSNEAPSKSFDLGGEVHFLVYLRDGVIGWEYPHFYSDEDDIKENFEYTMNYLYEEFINQNPLSRIFALPSDWIVF